MRGIFVWLLSCLAALALAGLTPQAAEASCLAPPAGLVGWWSGDGTTQDLALGNNGVPQNGATFGAGIVDQAFQLDGVDDQVAVADSASLRPAQFTIDAWIKTSRQTGPFNPQFIVARSGGSAVQGYELSVNYTNGVARLDVLQNISVFATATGTTDLTDGQWHHVAGSYDGSTMRVYVDGVLEGTRAYTGGVGYGAGDPLLIGRRQRPTETAPFQGLIDEVEVFHRALSAAEIQSIYAAGSDGKCKPAPPPPGTASWWPGDGHGQDIVDGRHLSLLNGANFAPGIVGEAFNFDGVDDFATDGTSVNILRTFFVAMWVKPAAYPSSVAYLTSKFAQVDPSRAEDKFLRLMSTGQVQFGLFFTNVSSQAVLTSGAATIPTGTWSHVVGVLEQVPSGVCTTISRMRLYVNGELVGTRCGDSADVIDSNGSLRFGSSERRPFFGGPGVPFHGQLDEILVGTSALSDSQVLAMFTAVAGEACLQVVPSVDESLIDVAATATGVVTVSGAAGAASADIIRVANERTGETVSAPVAGDGTFSLDIAAIGGDALKVTAVFFPDSPCQVDTSISLTFSGEAVTPPSGLVAWWPGDGDAMDIVGSNDGTPLNGASFADGKVGPAFSLDGANDHVQAAETGELDLNGGFTIDAWVKPDILSDEPIVAKYDFTGGNHGNVSYYLFIGNGVARFAVFCGPANTDFMLHVAGSVPAGQFTHVAAVYRGAPSPSMEIYINGALQPGTTTGSCTFINQNNVPVRIGKRIDSASAAHFDGLIDEVEIFNRALSAAEIQSIFNAGSAGKDKSAVAAPEAPEVEASPPALTNKSKLVFKGSGVPGHRVVCRKGGVVVGEAIIGPDGSWTLETDPLLDGSHSLEIVQIEPVGGAESEPLTFEVTIDTTPPEKPVFGLSAGGLPLLDGGATSDNTLALSGTAEPGATVTVSFFDPTRNTTTTFSTTVDEQGNWSLVTDPMPDCHPEVTLVVTDEAGNQSEPTEPITITIDTVAPEIGPSTASPTLVAGGQGVVIEVVVEDDGGVEEVVCIIRVSGRPAIRLPMTPVPGQPNTWQVTYTPAPDDPSGGYGFDFEAEDGADNSATGPGGGFSVDNDPPVISGTSTTAPHSAGTTPVALPGDCVTTSAFVSDALAGVASVSALITQLDGSVVEVPLIQVGTSDEYQGQFCATQQSGRHTVLVVAKDKVGNRSERRCKDFDVDLPPVARAQDAVIDEGQTLVLDGSGSFDPEGQDLTAQWAFAGGPFPGLVATIGPAESEAVKDGPSGSGTATLTVTDPFGQMASAQASVTVRNVAPTVDAGPDQEIFSGQTVTVSAMFSDPGVLDAPWGFTINWGDGTSTTGSTDSQSAPIVASHQYFALGQHTVSIDVTDKDVGTGHYELKVTVKRLPVSINIKPGSNPNSVNTKGQAPVAILTTPTFDATQVDALSVRFGPRDVLDQPGGGGTEIHGKGHIEDSKELDDKSQDGDLDMVLHFDPAASGLTTKVPEACVRGVTLDGIHFEGCDAVRVVK